MKKIAEINIDLMDKYDLVEKYNKSVVSRNLISYIIEKASEYSSNSNYKIVVTKSSSIEYDSINLIKSGLVTEYNKAKAFHRSENLKQLFYLFVGIGLIFLSTIFKNEVIKEILSISAWVPLWETVDLALFSEAREVTQIGIIRNLIDGEIIEKIDRGELYD